VVGAAQASTGIYALRTLRHPPARVTVFLDALREFIGSPPIWRPRLRSPCASQTSALNWGVKMNIDGVQCRNG
jgi:hypothetical protein